MDPMPAKSVTWKGRDADPRGRHDESRRTLPRDVARRDSSFAGTTPGARQALAAGHTSTQGGQRQPDADDADKQDGSYRLHDQRRLPAPIEEGAEPGEEIGHRVEAGDCRHPA